MLKQIHEKEGASTKYCVYNKVYYSMQYMLFLAIIYTHHFFEPSYYIL